MSGRSNFNFRRYTERQLGIVSETIDTFSGQIPNETAKDLEMKYALAGVYGLTVGLRGKEDPAVYAYASEIVVTNYKDNKDKAFGEAAKIMADGLERHATTVLNGRERSALTHRVNSLRRVAGALSQK